MIDLGNHDAVDAVTKLPKIPMTEEAALAGIQQMTKTRNGKTAAYSTVNSAVVALRFYHEEAGKPVATELLKKLRSLLEGEMGWVVPDECWCCTGRGAGDGGVICACVLTLIFWSLFAGFKRTRSKMKENGELPQTEGKMPMSVAVFRYLCLATLAATSDVGMHLFAHTFLLITWTMVNRSVSTATLSFANIEWAGDCLVIGLPRNKCDQGGDKAVRHHIYANPTDPAVCPVLALALYVFCCSAVGSSVLGAASPLLFGKSNTEARFCEWLGRFVVLHKAEIERLDSVTAEMYGSHSIRKGASTFLSSILEGPSTIAVFLRAGWDIGTQRRYIHPSGQDGFVGRCLALLAILGGSFGVLPPHFAPLAPIFLAGETWATVLPGFAHLPQSFRPVLLPLLASLVYHRDWLKKTLPRNHPYFKSAVVTSGVVDRLADAQIVLSGSFNNPVSGMVATGVPPSAVLLEEIKTQSATAQANFDGVMTRLGSVEQVLGLLPERVARTVSDAVTINGVVPLTRASVEEIVVGAVQSAVQQLQGSIQAGAAAASAAASVGSVTPVPDTVTDANGFRAWNHSGRLGLYTPADFVLEP